MISTLDPAGRTGKDDLRHGFLDRRAFRARDIKSQRT
jgi:hypothetical protein